MKMCETEGCEGELKPGSKLPTCSNCRAGVSRWMKRSPAHVLTRRRKLTLYGERINEVIDNRGIKVKK